MIFNWRNCQINHLINRLQDLNAHLCDQFFFNLKKNTDWHLMGPLNFSKLILPGNIFFWNSFNVNSELSEYTRLFGMTTHIKENSSFVHRHI